MVYSLQQAVVEDYERWKTTVEELADRRAESGCLGSRLFRSPGNPNEVAILCEWESEQKARDFIDEVVPRKQWETARVYSYELQFLEHVEDLEA